MMIKKQGFAAIYIAILVSAAIFSLASSLFVLTLNQQKISKNVVNSSRSYFAAESGLEDAILRAKKSMDLPSGYTFSVDAAIVQISVDSPSQNTKIIQSTGTAPDNIFRKLEGRLAIESVNPQFFYGAQAGVLGINMENNSKIQGAGGLAGNVYSNGSITGDNGATITGNAFVATGMSLDQSHVVYNSGQIFGRADPIIDIAQSFIPSAGNSLVKVSLYIKKVGDPDDRTVKILTNSGSSPTKTVLASAKLDEDLVGTSFGWVDVVFSSPPALTAGVVYWLMIDASRDGNDYWVCGKDQNMGYGQGQAKYSQDWSAGSPVWLEIIGDLDFKVYLGGQITFLKDVIVLGDAHANDIDDSKICGDGYYQTIDSYSLNFLNNPSQPVCPNPLTPGAAVPGSTDPPLQNMPISDSNINQWKQDAILGGVYSGNLSITSSISYGPKKIDGNLIMTSNNKTLTVDGTIYVTGYIDISNGSGIKCAAAYGLASCIVLTDKWVHIENNGVFQGSGQLGSYIMILSDSGCDGSFSTGCTHHNAAMDIHNGATGAVFYANNGLVYLHNGVAVTELAAKKINLEPGATVNYEQGLINAGFSSGPGGSWQVSGWKEIQ
ncbi:MAG: hypothetical protein V1705_02645 [bacterium]